MSNNSQKWWSSLKPTSFKEVGAAFLSVVLISLLLWVAVETFGMINTLPEAVKIDDTVQVIDTYARSKEILSILFPFFGAVVTFWLGVAVEGKRADENKDRADKVGKDLEIALGKVADFRATHEKMIGTGKLLVSELEDTIKTAKSAMTGAALDRTKKVLEEAKSSLEEAEKAI